MSSTSDATTYSISVSDPMGHCDGYLNLSYTGTDPVVTDDFVLGLAKTLQSYQWPTGVTPEINVNKAVNHGEGFSGNLTTDPPVFQ